MFFWSVKKFDRKSKDCVSLFSHKMSVFFPEGLPPLHSFQISRNLTFLIWAFLLLCNFTSGGLARICKVHLISPSPTIFSLPFLKAPIDSHVLLLFSLLPNYQTTYFYVPLLSTSLPWQPKHFGTMWAGHWAQLYRANHRVWLSNSVGYLQGLGHLTFPCISSTHSYIPPLGRPYAISLFPSFSSFHSPTRLSALPFSYIYYLCTLFIFSHSPQWGSKAALHHSLTPVRLVRLKVCFWPKITQSRSGYKNLGFPYPGLRLLTTTPH